MKKTPYALPRAVLWDWDNTLVDSWNNIHRALAETFVHMGRAPWTLEETKKNVHRALEDSFPPLFGEKWREAGKYYRSTFERIHLDGLASLPGAEGTLAYLRERGVYCAVVSNKRGENLRRESGHLGWNAHFSGVFGALDVPAAKPAPDLVTKALENSGISAGKDVWLVGDSLSDMRCAHASGCVPVLFGDASHVDPAELALCPPDYRASNHAALQELLRGTAQ
ncbi:MAG: HAD family hydrolase [Rickettsiales bacterium]